MINAGLVEILNLYVIRVCLSITYAYTSVSILDEHELFPNRMTKTFSFTSLRINDMEHSLLEHFIFVPLLVSSDG